MQQQPRILEKTEQSLSGLFQLRHTAMDDLNMALVLNETTQPW